MDGLLSRLAAIFSPERILVFLVDELLPDLIVAALTLTAFWFLWRVLDRSARAVMQRSQLDRTAQDFTSTILKYVLATLAAVTALAQLGIDTTSILTSLGVASLTIGFAAKDALSNIISGIFIFWDRPFVLGDLIEMGDVYGRVDSITMRSTRVVTPDGRMLAIPNTEIVNSTVASYTNFPNLRLDLPITVGTGEDLGRVRAVLLELAATRPELMAEPAPVVVMTAINDYNLAIELRAWLADERQHVPMRAALLEAAFEALRAAGVDMPCETFSLNPVAVRQTAA